MRTSRSAVYAAIDSERSYQDHRWGDAEAARGEPHSIEEWFLFIEDYVDEARHILSREDWRTAHPKALHILRKVAALAVVGMEHHGAPLRTSTERSRVQVVRPEDEA